MFLSEGVRRFGEEPEKPPQPKRWWEKILEAIREVFATSVPEFNSFPPEMRYELQRWWFFSRRW